MRTGRGAVPVLAMLIAAVASGATPHALSAQDEFDARRELVLGGPTAVGVLFPISERWSFRADGTVGGTVSGIGGTSAVGPSAGWNYVIGASMLRHVPGDGPVRSYLLGRFGYQRSMPDGSPAAQTFVYSAGFGVSMRVADQAAVFSELTAQFSYSSSNNGGQRPYATSWNTTSRIGVMVRRRGRRG
jgi:hypothetical protein